MDLPVYRRPLQLLWLIRENEGMENTTLSPRSLELAQTLVRMNTVSANSNLALIHFIRDELKSLGVSVRLTYNAEKTKANLFATLGEGKPSGVILSGHTDTVPWDGQDWSVDPLARRCAKANYSAEAAPT